VTGGEPLQKLEAVELLPQPGGFEGFALLPEDLQADGFLSLKGPQIEDLFV
jgi:hypothetical protein